MSRQSGSEYRGKSGAHHRAVTAAEQNPKELVRVQVEFCHSGSLRTQFNGVVAQLGNTLQYEFGAIPTVRLPAALASTIRHLHQADGAGCRLQQLALPHAHTTLFTNVLSKDVDFAG